MKMPLIFFLFLFGPVIASSKTSEDMDFNQDGVVNFIDFLFFATAYGTANSRLDFNENGIVDFPDFLEFLHWYGHTVPVLPLSVTFTSFPDTVQIDQPENFDILIDISTIASGCDVTEIRFGTIEPQKGDSLAVQVILIEDTPPQIHGSRVIVEAHGNSGNRQLGIEVSACRQVVRDTLTFIVIPKIQ